MRQAFFNFTETRRFMKKHCTVLFFLCVVGSLVAQVKMGLAGGLNISGYNFEDSNTEALWESRVGYHVGLIADFGVANAFAIQPGIFFTQKGGRTGEGDNEVDQSVSYMELPLILRLRFGIGRNNFFIAGGGYLGYALNGRQSSDNPDLERANIRFGQDSDDDLKATDYGLQAGAGLELLGRLIFTAQYQAGLNNLSPDDDNERKFTNQNIVLTLGIYLN